MVREFPLSSALPIFDAGKKSSNILGPNIGISLSITLPQKLTEFEIDSLKHGTAAIYVEGRIFYSDIFDKRHSTHYRLMHHRSSGRIGVNTALVFCTEGNYGD